MNILDYAIAKKMFGGSGSGEVSGTIDINENGTYNVAKYAHANVNVPTPTPKLQEKTVTENGEVVADSGYDGLSKVTVNVASGGGEAQATLNAVLDRSITEIESDIGTVGRDALANTQLRKANFPNATSVEMGAFTGCHNLSSASLPSVTKIAGSVFYNCNTLTKVIIGTNQTTVATLQTAVFNNCYHILGKTHNTHNPTGAKDGYIYVPHSLVADYRSATNWATYATQIMPYVATVGELANIDGTTYDKACVGEDYVEYTYNGTSWEVYR